MVGAIPVIYILRVYWTNMKIMKNMNIMTNMKIMKNTKIVHKFPAIAAMLQPSPEAKVLWAEVHLSVKLLHDLGMGELVC